MAEAHLAFLMVGLLFALILAGYPVGFTLGGLALAFGLLGPDPDLLFLLPQRIYGIMQNVTLIAVPLFIFMGVTLERSGLAERLLDTMGLLFGRLKGGVAYAVVISGALVAASTGIVGASVVTMGLISLPLMLKRGYKTEFSCGLICASGTLGQIIPPSIVLILLADQMGQTLPGITVGELFLAAVGPGLLLVVAYLLYGFFVCQVGRGCEGVEEENLPMKELAWRLSTALLAPLILIVVVLGSIFFGVATPTEAASIGALGSLLLAWRKMDYLVLSEICKQTTRLSCMVFMILFGASAFSLVFRSLGGDEAISELIAALQVGEVGFLIFVMLLLFILGCFLDFIEIIFVVIPILSPIIFELGYDPLWFAVLIAINLQTAFLTPPLGFALFYLKGVAPKEVSTAQIYRGVIPFVLIQLGVLGLLMLVPEIATWLPQKVTESIYSSR